jgi:hypothetical protein
MLLASYKSGWIFPALSAIGFTFCVILSPLHIYAQAKTEVEVIKTYVAVLDIPSTGIDGAIITDKLISELVKKSEYALVERERISEILKEQGFQQTGCTDKECAVQIGRIAGVDKIITGRTGIMGNGFVLTLRLIDVKTAEIERSAVVEIPGTIEDVYRAGVEKAANELCRPLAAWERAGITRLEYDRLSRDGITDSIIALHPWIACGLTISEWRSAFTHSITCADYKTLSSSGIRPAVYLSRPWESAHSTAIEWKTGYLKHRHATIKNAFLVSFSIVGIGAAIVAGFSYVEASGQYNRYAAAGRADATALGDSFEQHLKTARISAIIGSTAIAAAAITIAIR